MKREGRREEKRLLHSRDGGRGGGVGGAKAYVLSFHVWWKSVFLLFALWERTWLLWVRNWVEISGLTCTILDRYLYWWVVGLEGYIRRFLM
jgi:hypothetical protein